MTKGCVAILGLLAVLAPACAGSAPRHAAVATTAHGVDGVRVAEGRPPLAVLVRDGDPSAALALAVDTSGAIPGRDAEVAVAVAGLVEMRLATAGLGAAVVPGAEGVRVRLLVPEGAARGVVTALREALTTSVSDGGSDEAAALRKLDALHHLPVPDPALGAATACSGELVGVAAAGGSPALETWRAASGGLGRVVLAAVGPRDDVEAIAAALAEAPAWPLARPRAGDAGADLTESLRVYDGSPDVPAGAARVTLVARAPEPERAMFAARELGDPQGRLVERLGAVSRRTRFHDVTAGVHPGWSCVRLAIDVDSPAGESSPPAELATTIDVARAELRRALRDTTPAPTAREIANRADDPREAAERLAYATLTSHGTAHGEPPAPEGSLRIATAVGVSGARAPSAPSPPLDERAAEIQKELDQLEPSGQAWSDLRVRIEDGQAGTWLVLASPCGTESETSGDAGSSALAVLATANHARRASRAGDSAEAWVAPDGVGILVHGFASGGESPASLAARLAGIAARGLESASPDERDFQAARTALLARGASDEVRAFSLLGEAVAPGHPSWLLPFGTVEAVERSSDEAVLARLDALRSGPLRAAVLGAQAGPYAEAIGAALAQWSAKRPQDRRSCPAVPAVTPRPGTYALEVPGANAAAWLAVALPSGDAPALEAARVLGAALDAKSGLLERALGAGLARAWSARVVGPPRSPALVVHVVAPQPLLDAAVAEVRVLFDRLRQEGLSDADRALATGDMARHGLETSVDPKSRLIALWRGDAPPAVPLDPEALRAFAARTLKDEALIIVAVRPARTPLPR